MARCTRVCPLLVTACQARLTNWIAQAIIDNLCAHRKVYKFVIAERTVMYKHTYVCMYIIS